MRTLAIIVSVLIYSTQMLASHKLLTQPNVVIEVGCKVVMSEHMAELPNFIYGTAYLIVHEYGGFTWDCIPSNNTCGERNSDGKLIIDPCGQSPYVQGPMYVDKVIMDYQYLGQYFNEELGVYVDRHHIDVQE
jgi:hypothetical protein